MTPRRPRDIGTHAETAVVRTARTRGFPNADRYALHGAADVGDIHLCPRLIVEVKGGETARQASDALIHTWLDQTAHERDNAGAMFGFLVVQRRGVGAPNAARWWSWWRLAWLAQLHGTIALVPYAPVRLTLGDSLAMLRAAGWGEPAQVTHESVGGIP